MYWTGLKTFYQLRRNLRMPLQVLKARQFQALRQLVEFAYRCVPFYTKLYDETGFSPMQLKEPDDVALIPTTRKALFQQAPLEDAIASEHDVEKLVRKRTSGSSGSPLIVYYTPEDRIYRTMLHLRILFHNGMGLRDRMAHISDSRHSADWRYGFQKLGFLAKEFVYAADPPEKQLEVLQTINPDVIYSYASCLVLLAAEIEKRGACPIRPKLVFTTGELLNADDRMRINRALSVQLRDIYGIVEMGDVAWQCPALDGYHLNIDSFYVEVDADGKPGSPGETGRLIITNLHSRALPFIRYQVGDIVTAPEEKPCACGCTFPLIQVLQGRADDWLYSADGKRVSPLIFVVASIPGVQQYRMIQKAYDHLIVEILPGQGFTQQTLAKAKEHVQQVMGAGLRVAVLQVKEIPRDPSGKMRRVISEIKK